MQYTDLYGVFCHVCVFQLSCCERRESVMYIDCIWCLQNTRIKTRFYMRFRLSFLLGYLQNCEQGMGSAGLFVGLCWQYLKYLLTTQPQVLFSRWDQIVKPIHGVHGQDFVKTPINWLYTQLPNTEHQSHWSCVTSNEVHHVHTLRQITVYVLWHNKQI